MGKYFCNPLNVSYKYQFNDDARMKQIRICREAADPSMILFKGRYYIFASMSLGVYYSDDLANWSYAKLPSDMPLYDYAPDVRVIGEYVYFCASSRERNCDRYRTKDIINGPYEKVPGNIMYWDPNLFLDDDGRIYFYYGCSNVNPIFGCELDPNTMNPKNEPKGLIYGRPFELGYERVGDNNSILPASEEEVEIKYQAFLKHNPAPESMLTPELKYLIRGMFTNKPYIEGAWMDKFNGKYYLQYACPGTQYNTYGDGYYVSDSPLGEFKLGGNNPFSYKPGGFINGAGHGSTMRDKENSLWHTSTMRISNNHDFERRIGLFKAGIDAEGDLFCNQRYADYPYDVEKLRENPWADPEWNLLSYKKNVTCSSCEEGYAKENIVDENIKTLWLAKSNQNEWVEVDLGDVMDVRAIQVNFGDPKINMEPTGPIQGSKSQARYIEEKDLFTRYILEGSTDGKNYFVIEDKSKVSTDLTHDLIVREEGIQVRFVKVSICEVAYNLNPALSGVRVFGLNSKAVKAKAPNFEVTRINDLDAVIKIEKVDNVTGYNVLFGKNENKLYHSYMTFDTELRIGALIKGEKYYFRVDAFNEKGITTGKVKYED